MNIKNKKLNILCLPREFFPTNRAILADLWNNEIAKTNNLHWVMLHGGQSTKVTWGSSRLTLVKLDRSSNSLIAKFKLLFVQIKRFSECKKLFKENDFNYIFVRNGVMESLMALYFKRKHNVKFCFHLSSMHGYHDIFKESSSTFSSALLYNLKNRYLKIFFYNFILKRADIVLPISSYMSKLLASKVGSKQKLLPSPLSGPEAFLFPSSKNQNSEKNLLKGGKKLLHLGVISNRRRSSTLFKIIKELKEFHSDIVLNILGHIEANENKDIIQKLSEEYGVSSNINFIGKVTYQEVPRYIKQADVGIISIPPEPKYMVSSPTKFIELLSVGVPVVFNREIHLMRNISRKSLSGIGVDYNNIGQYVQAIRFLLDNNQLSKKLGKNGSTWVRENFTNKRLSEQIIKKMHTAI